MLRLSTTKNLVNRANLSRTSLLVKKQLYHDDGVYGYRVAKEYKLPDYTTEELSNRMKHGSLLRMVQAYRTHGHEGAHLDPLNIMKRK
jgi:probable 2-oxoglutarate dehydrogenase E1 component DHKTD1